jgi:predicted RNase H-like HicB family nuclease
VAFNPETGTTSQGEPVEPALANLKEATELFLEEQDSPERAPAGQTPKARQPAAGG